jgi:protein-disulfide isomerase
MDTPSEGSYTSPKRSGFAVPLAIVIAGIIIAGAVYFGLEKSHPNSPPPTVDNQAQNEPPQPTIGDIRAVSDADHVRGATNPKITMIEYSDLECPFCKQFHATLQKLMAAHPNDIRWVYRHFPIVQLHSKAKNEALAAECAGEQGKFWEFVDKVFAVTPSNNGLEESQLPTLAKTVGVKNIAQFQSCLKSEKYSEVIDKDLADAEVAGGQGTPHTVLIKSDGSKEAIIGAQAYETLEAKIKSAL